MTQIQPKDVLFGRGGATNNHEGNRNFRKLVADHQPIYLMARKRDKRDIAQRIVSLVRSVGGRFLKRDESNSNSENWIDVGDKRACEKTSQALREGLDIRRNGTSTIKTVPVKKLKVPNIIHSSNTKKIEKSVCPDPNITKKSDHVAVTQPSFLTSLVQKSNLDTNYQWQFTNLTEEKKIMSSGSVIKDQQSILDKSTPVPTIYSPSQESTDPCKYKVKHKSETPVVPV